jgi:hypothetical protein
MKKKFDISLPSNAFLLNNDCMVHRNICDKQLPVVVIFFDLGQKPSSRLLAECPPTRTGVSFNFASQLGPEDLNNNTAKPSSLNVRVTTANAPSG